MILARLFRPTVALAALAVAGAVAFAARPQDTEAKSDTDNSKFGVPMAVQWKFSTNYIPNNPASPSITDDSAYFSSGNRLFAVDRKTGAQKWRYPKDGTLNTFIAATPVVSNGTVFFSAGDGLYALDAENGTQRWPHVSIKGGAQTTPVILGDTLFFASSNGKLYAIDTKTGAARGGTWSPGGSEGVDIGELVSDVTSMGDMLYFVTSDEVLSSISLATGVRKWVQRLGAADPRVSKPVLSGEVLYVAAGSNLLNFRSMNGQPRWSVPFPNNIVAPPAVDDSGNAYVVTGDRTIYAIDSRGRGFWKQPAMVDYEVITEPVIVGNTLLVSTTLGYIYAFDTTTGALKWNYSIEPSSANPNSIPSSTNIAAKPVVAGGALYVLSDDGALTTFSRTAPDFLPPAMTRIEPEQGDYLNGRPPFRIGAKIEDEGSGLRLDTLTMKLDDRNIPRRPPGRENLDKPGFAYNPDTGLVEYTIFDTSGESRAEILRDGHHTATISVKDWMGNTLTKTWTFYIDDTLKKRSKVQSAPSRNQNGPPGAQGRGGPGVSGGGGGKLGGGGGGGGGGAGSGDN